jgi:predicted nucleic acid-binding protein
MLDGLFASTNVRSGDVMDVHLAALAIEHGLTLCSNDRGFAQFPKLHWMNPLAASQP